MQSKISKRDESPEWNKMMTHYAKSETGIDMREAKKHICHCLGQIYPKEVRGKNLCNLLLFFQIGERRELLYTFMIKFVISQEKNMYYSGRKICLPFKGLNWELGCSFFARYFQMPGLILTLEEQFWQLLAKRPTTWLRRFLYN